MSKDMMPTVLNFTAYDNSALAESWMPFVTDCNTLMQIAVEECGDEWEMAYREYLSKNPALHAYLEGLRKWANSLFP